MVPVWQEAGIEVTEIFGIRKAPPADVAFLHIDLSVIPPAYLEFARCYPVAINGSVADIRKSRLSILRVDLRSGYSGPVIVKSSHNFAGNPERFFFHNRSRLQRLFTRKPTLPSYPIRLESKADYRIYENATEVPAAVWTCDDLVVEKFMPERHGDLYCLREWYFCGSENFQWVELSSDPIFTAGQQAHHLQVPLPPELPALREKLGFDYGKFDFTMVDGRPVVFDFNKTTGLMNPQGKEIGSVARQLAGGIAGYFR